MHAVAQVFARAAAGTRTRVPEERWNAMARSARTVRNGLLALGVAGALLLAGGGAAGADAPDTDAPGTARAEGGDWIHVSMVWGEEPTGNVNSAFIRCPDGGGHPRNSEACAALDEVDGDIWQIRRTGTACPFIYEPVTAVAYGKWKGRRVAYAKAFPNECVLHASTGPVFELG
ncbi:SSI family serine proteinase inhibitor [Streptomyces sp. NPDC050504]|uniref:SSI family serine proteinase inhibitor n=1 Tax=Streptomyces sp. NPDC050504 TaxID=3365618 RepID=UPI0037A5AA17